MAVAIPCFSHPHYFKEVRFSFEREADSGKWISASHITVPYNEIAAGSLEDGKSWHLGFAKIEVGTDMTLGGAAVVPGQYSLNVLKGEGEAWSLFLKPEAEDEKDEQLPLEGELITDLDSKEHLIIEIHPIGDKEETQVVLEVRFGPNLLQVPVELRD